MRIPRLMLTVVGLGLSACQTNADSEAAEAPMGQSQVGQEGDVVLITGSTDGLGREVALRVARTGAHVIVHGRNEERGQEVVSRIEDEGVGSARFYPADLASLDQVRGFGEAILRDYDRLDVLVNNAGIWLTGDDERRLSEDGHELQFAVNYLSHFLLTEMLLPLLQASAPSRIVNVASGAQRALDFDDLMIDRDYTGSRGYSQSKLAQILHAYDLAESLEGTGVSVNALHPASLMDTNMVIEAGREPRSTVDEGAEALMQLVTASGIGSGRYFNGLNPARANDQAYDAEARTMLRAISLELVGLN